jgi:hypothetical protein
MASKPFSVTSMERFVTTFPLAGRFLRYTLTNFADHSEKFSHDVLNRYVAGERLQPKLT